MSAYWAQYSHTEIMSMHGVELDDCHDDDDEDYDFSPDEDEEQEEGCCCSMGCNDCLMVSW